MQNNLDLKRIGIFLGFAFGIAWAAGLVIALTGGLTNSPKIGPVNLAFILLSVVYMGAPAIAHVLTRALTGEGWRDLWLRLHYRQGWLFWLIAWVLPAILVIAGGALFFLLLPEYFDPQLQTIRKMLEAAPGGAQAGISPWTVVALQTLQAVLIAPVINSLFTFGEEFGWRAYLMPKLMVLGARKALLALGVIWGVWHWPVIFMGYEYGDAYPGYPVVGPLLFCLITFGLSAVLGWFSWRGRSVWPAVIGHAAFNGIAALPLLMVQGEPNRLLGPAAVGLVGGLPLLALAVWLFLSPKVWIGGGLPPKPPSVGVFEQPGQDAQA